MTCSCGKAGKAASGRGKAAGGPAGCCAPLFEHQPRRTAAAFRLVVHPSARTAVVKHLSPCGDTTTTTIVVVVVVVAAAVVVVVIVVTVIVVVVVVVVVTVVGP